jgi:AcrR family transcriptional regulator
MAGSHTCLSGCTRRDPKQRRGEERVDGLLRAAVAEFAATGYEGATMSGIARRAGASIGSLYQFFPDKEAVARAVRTRHMEDVERQWDGIDPRGLDAFVDRFVDLMLVFVEEHPAFLPLQDAPASTQPVEPRNRLKTRLAKMLRKVSPGLGAAETARIGEMILTTNKAFMGLYARSERSARRWVEEEYREVLRGLLGRGLVCGGARRRARRSGPVRGPARAHRP